MSENCEYLRQLNPKQMEICLCDDDMLLMACPGSGKTRTITYKLAYMAEKFRESKKWNIAITYTNRAAQEIEERLSKLDVSLANVWTGTIHQFCMHFIIRPYAMYSQRLKNGYKIIDEYTTKQYGREIANQQGISLDYYDDPFEYSIVGEIYEQKLIDNKEIDFQQILHISKQLITDNTFIAENISKIIRSIYVDEYQDTQEVQYQILAPIARANKSLNIMFVGDVNQSIYGNLGGVAKTVEQLNALMLRDFKEEYLSGCYRSTQRIVDFYTCFEISHTGVASCSSDLKSLKGTICYNSIIKKNDLADIISKIIAREISEGTREDEICVIAPQWGLLFSMSNALKKRLPGVQFDAPEVSPFKRDPLNPFYLMARLIYSPSGVNSQIRKKLANGILLIFRDEYHAYMDENIDAFDVLRIINSFKLPGTDGIDYYEACVKWMLHRIGIDLEYEVGLMDTFNSYLQKSRERIENHKITNTNEAISAYFHERKGVVLNTLHGIKGEEYTTVVAFGLLNGYLPYWDYISDPAKKSLREIETNKLLYVLCSRAKKNLYLFSEAERYTKKGKLYYPTDELKRVAFTYDELLL